MSNRKLLLADDSVTIQKVVNLTFADEGIEVIAVGDGEAAIASVTDVKPDVVLADVHMPGLNGYEVCELIRQNDATKDLPVVLLVGSFEPFDDSEAVRVGANAHLTKPFQSIKLLVEQVRQLMPESADKPSPEMDNGGKPVAGDTAEVRTPDTSDIEKLYAESFAETVEIAKDAELPADFVDAGMDDEIIETSYAPDDGTEIQRERQPDGVSLQHDQPESRTVSEPPHDDISFEETVSLDLPDDPRSPFSELASANAADTEVNLDECFEAPAAETSPRPAGDDFEDLELLELPPSGSDRLELTTEPLAAAAGSKARLVSLSPELLEIIVQKVVEKLSEKD